MSFKAMILAALFLLAPTVVLAQEEQFTRAELLDKIDAVVLEAMADEPVAGISIGISMDETRITKGYGYADIENGVKATEHTVYRIGSITKQFTAAAIMMLVERGELKLEDELTQFLPDYPTQGHRVTIHQLLNHTSGIKSMTDPDLWGTWRRLDATHDEVIARFSGEPFNFAPGKELRYNNSAYYLLGVIIEQVSGQSYADFLREQVWNPLGMRETHYMYNSPIIKNRAEGYTVREGLLLNDDPLSLHVPFSAGALGATVVNLLLWQEALHGRRLMGEDSYQRMITPVVLNGGSALPDAYGYGLIVGSFEGHRKLYHFGVIAGFTSALFHYPDDDLSIAILSNTSPFKTAPIENALARVMLGIPETDIEDEPARDRE